MTGVPMARGHLYLPRPAAWAPGRRSGAGLRLQTTLRPLRLSPAPKLIAIHGSGPADGRAARVRDVDRRELATHPL